MAEAAVLERDSTDFRPLQEPDEPTEAQQEPSKKKHAGGRPEGTTKEKLEKDREHDTRSFAEILADVSKSDANWERHMLYIWRTDPWYDNTNGGVDKKYIGKTAGPVSEDTLKAEYGSGSYKVQLNKAVSPNSDKPVAHVYYHILDPKYPPYLPPGDWLNNVKNKKWQSWRPLIEQRWNEEVARQIKAPAAVASSESAAISELTKLVHRLIEDKTGKPATSSEAEKLTTQLVTWALNQKDQDRKSEREADSPSKLAELIGAVKSLIVPAKGDGIDPTLNLIITNLRDDLKSARDDAKAERENNRKLVESLIAGKREEANPLSQLDMFSNIFERMTSLAGRGGPRDWKEVIADAASDVLPKALELGQAYVTQKAINDRLAAGRPPAPAPRPMQPGAAAATPPPASTAVPAAPVAATTAAPPTAAPASTAAPDPNAPAGTAGPEMDLNERTMLVNIAMLASQALNLALKGDEFAEKVCDKFGGVAYDDFIAAFDKSVLLDKLKAVPEAWQFLAEHEPRLAQFIDDFYAFAEDPPDEPEPAPAKAAKPAKKPAAAKGKKK